MPADLTPAEIEAMRLRAGGEPPWSALPPHTPLEDDLSADVIRLLAVVDALTARLAEARKLHVGIRAALDAEAGAAAPAPWVRNDIDPKREGIAWYRRWEADGSEPGEGDTDQTRVAWVQHNPKDMTTWCWEIEAPTRGVFGKQIAHGEGYELAYEALAACDEYAEIEARDAVEVTP